ncbi:hypothetical protein HMN09_00875200 [Mycena chlorophos]|uniref:DUF3669 domain-containing protein n=1 Tax=Mycena chlorophos TaxID=658473 RepID=A0A8H6W1U4_MYCCL|nr:hypothetical protein HMN09_00875200 [Mycena chlorophos]
MSSSAPPLGEPQLQAVGQGSFGKVWLLTQTPYAFKTVLNTDSSADLEKEWSTLVGVYATCSSTSFFAIPRPLAAFLPESTDQVRFAPPSPSIAPRQFRNRKRPPIPLPQSIFHENGFTAATYAMTFIHNVPPLIAEFVVQNFYSEKAQAAKVPKPNLLRIYFGRDGPEQVTSRFINSKNFAVNITQYTRLADVFKLALSAPADVSQGMGEMIAKLHWLQGCDARDVEFVIGDTGSGGVEYWLLDFNQVGCQCIPCRRDLATDIFALTKTRKFDREAGDIDELVQAHFFNDPYFPIARAADPLFAAFQLGYRAVLENCPYNIQARGEQFLTKLMEKQAEKDASQANKEAAGIDALNRPLT